MCNERCLHTTDIDHGGTRRNTEEHGQEKSITTIQRSPPPPPHTPPPHSTPIPPIIQPWSCSTVMGGVSFPCDLHDLRVLRVVTLLFSAFLPSLCALCVRLDGRLVLEMAEELLLFFGSAILCDLRVQSDDECCIRLKGDLHAIALRSGAFSLTADEPLGERHEPRDGDRRPGEYEWPALQHSLQRLDVPVG